jgi:hypothetical protein
MLTISLLRVSRRKWELEMQGLYFKIAIQIRIATGKGFQRDGREGSCPT